MDTESRDHMTTIIAGPGSMVLLAVGGAAAPTGIILIIAGAGWKEGALYWPDTFDTQGTIGAVALVLGLVLLVTGWIILRRANPSPTRDERFQAHIVGLGYALLVAAICLGTIIVKLVMSDEPMDGAGPKPEELLSLAHTGVLLAISIMSAVVGALFFVTNAIHQLRRDGKTEFSAAIFWGGLWFRLGEAALFALVFFWLFWIAQLQGTTIAIGGTETVPSFMWLPIICLLLGMFVKSGEKLVFALSTQLLGAVTRVFTTPTTSGENTTKPDGG